jgi:hypothetical protein
MRRLLVGAIILLATFPRASAQTIPDKDDKDLDGLRTAVLSARESAKPCVRGSCAQFSCRDAIALGKSLDDARIAMAVMQQRLHDAFEQHVKKQGELSDEYGRNQGRDEDVRKAYIWSKAFSNAGKIYLKAAAMAESVEHLKDARELLEVNDLETNLLSLLRDANDMKALLDNGLEGIADLKTVYNTPEDDATRKKLDEASEQYLEARSGVTEALNALTNARLSMTLYRAPNARVRWATDPSSKMRSEEALRSSLATAGQEVGKVLLEVAESRQSGLLDELKEIALVQKAINKNFADTMGDTNRITARYAKVQELRRLVADVFAEQNVCVAQCPDAPGLQPVPDTSGSSYGEVLKAYNAKVLSLTADISTGASRFVAKEGIEPKIAATPATVAVGETESATFSLAACKATEGAQFKLTDVSGPAVLDESLGSAKPSAPGSLRFPAPGPPGDYAIKIVDQHSRTLAAATFTVVKPDAAKKSGSGEGKKTSSGTRNTRATGRTAKADSADAKEENSTAHPVSAVSFAPGKYAGRLRIENLSACEEFAFERLNRPAGPAETDAFLTISRGGAAMVIESENSTKSGDFFATTQGTLMVSGDHFTGGIRHKTLYYFEVTFHHDAGSGQYVGTGTWIMQDQCEASYPVTIRLDPVK